MKVFVYEGYNQVGATYMAYHIGLILHRHFGLSVSVVGALRPDAPQFDYPVVFPVLGHEQLVATCRAEDLLICNASFSRHMFGPTLPCRKLSYVQHMRTFPYLDGFFDHYVFVSHFVKSFVEGLFDIAGPVIPGFVHVPPAGILIPLAARANRALILEYKTPEAVRQRFLEVFRVVAPASQMAVDVLPTLPQGALATEIRASRYFVNLTVLEGFGLPMLEAMANGCAVVGWANGGNAEYAHDRENCRLVRYPRLDDLAATLAYLAANGDEASRLANAGRKTAEGFSYARFEASWIDLLQAIL